MKILETLKFIGRIRSNKNRQRGFTLIELVVVIAILGVLIAVAVPQFGNFQDQAELNAAASSLSSSAGTQFASDYLDGDTSDWEATDAEAICEDLISTLDNDDEFDDYSVKDADGSAADAATFSVPSIDDGNGNGDEVVSRECEVTF